MDVSLLEEIKCKSKGTKNVKYTLNSALFILVACLLTLGLFSGHAFGETVYVKGVMKITMRTGPGVEHKIVTMVESGDSLEILERNDDWSRVRSPKGKDGWVLTRYVTLEVPVILLADRLKKENLELAEMLDKLKTKNAELSGTEAKFQDLEKSYSLLKKGAADFLSLKQKHDKVTKEFKEQQERISGLEKRLGNEDVKWFLSGAGVLIVGLILGMSARNKKRGSLFI